MPNRKITSYERSNNFRCAVTHLPERYLKAMNTAGLSDVGEYPLPEKSLGEHVKELANNQIIRFMISISTPGKSFCKGETAAQLVRSTNEEIRDIKKKYPHKFGAFALLPLPDVEAALREIVYALDELQLDGVGLYTNYKGTYPGDEQLDAVFEELNKRKATVFFHPALPPAFEKINHSCASAMPEHSFETTRMVANLLQSGTIARYPHIKMIITHSSGTIPFLAARLASLAPVNSRQPEGFAQRVYQQYRSLYVDLTGITNPQSFSTLKALMPANHLLAGIDFPFKPTGSVPLSEKGICGNATPNIPCW